MQLGFMRPDSQRLAIDQAYLAELTRHHGGVGGAAAGGGQYAGGRCDALDVGCGDVGSYEDDGLAARCKLGRARGIEDDGARSDAEARRNRGRQRLDARVVGETHAFEPLERDALEASQSFARA